MCVAAWLAALPVAAQPAVPPSSPAAAPAKPEPAEAEPAPERLGDEAELARIAGLYEAGQYDDCAKELDALLDPKGKRPLTQANVKETARIYHSACLIGSGQFERADQPLRDAIRDNLQMKPPDSLVFPRAVVERFLRVQQSMNEEIRAAEAKRLERAKELAARKQEQERLQAARLAQLERLASREVVVEKNSRWVAVVPFGTGQFQNGDRSLGWFFLGAEVLAAGTAVASFAISSHIDRQAAELADANQPSNAGTRAHDWYVAGTVATWSFLGLAAAGIVEAQASFVPEVRYVRQRKLPPPPRVSPRESGLDAKPGVALGPGGVSLGVSGTF